MWIEDKVHRYLAISGLCLLLLTTLVGFDHISNDKAHFAPRIEQNIHDLETEATNIIREGDWISQVRSVENSGRILSNDLVHQI